MIILRHLAFHFPHFLRFISQQFKVMFRVLKVQSALCFKFHFTNDQIGPKRVIVLMKCFIPWAIHDC